MLSFTPLFAMLWAAGLRRDIEDGAAGGDGGRSGAVDGGGTFRVAGAGLAIPGVENLAGKIAHKYMNTHTHAEHHNQDIRENFLHLVSPPFD
jgi:hypothetical protein